MNQQQDNQFQNHSFTQASFEQPIQPEALPRRGFVEYVFGPAAARAVRSPLFITAGLLLTGTAFAAIVMNAYPDATKDESAIPIIKADAKPFKATPIEPGGMEIPHRDSTVFESFRSASNTVDGKPLVENLLSDSKPIMSKDITVSAAPEAVPAKKSNDSMLQGLEEARRLAEIAVAEEATPVVAAAPAAKTETAAPKPGASPETLAYVRSVLKKDGGAPAAQNAAKVEPAAGTEGPKTVAGGSYYVQLGSVRSQEGAAREWGGFQKKFSAELNGMDYRVQEANLGERGTYFRIQAGPLSKSAATQICDSIKTQKPGGCLVIR